MSAATILMVGLVAAANMLLVLGIAQAFRVETATMARDVVSFFIPERVKSRALPVAMHFLAGVAFTTAYAYLFKWVGTEGLGEYVAEGALVGFVHGFFVGVFFAAAISDDPVPFFHPPTALVSVAAHVVFGASVGAGLHLAQTNVNAVWFAVFDVAILAVAAGAFWIVKGQRAGALSSAGPAIPAVHRL
jgi:hypothetical protein